MNPNTKKFLIISVYTILLIFLIYKITQQIRDNYENQPQDPYTLNLINEIRHIDPKLDAIVDKLKFFEGNKSYTINKTYVHLCKYDENGELYNRNQLVLVLLHEAAHTLCDEVGHTKSFQAILDDLLKKAEKHTDKYGKKIYDSTIKHVDNYCNY